MEDDSKYHRMKWKKKNGFKEIIEVDVNGWTKLVAEKPLQKRIIAACGNDCSACPRYVAHKLIGISKDEYIRNSVNVFLKGLE